MKEGGWSQGNNALPVNDGRCCDECNMEFVIPARLTMYRGTETQDSVEGDAMAFKVFDSPSKGYYEIRDQYGYIVAQLVKPYGTAILLAAAPELLAALRQCAALLGEWVDSGSPDDADFEAVKAARKAIKKAEGIRKAEGKR